MSSYRREIHSRLRSWLKEKAQSLVAFTVAANIIGTAIYYLIQQSRLGAELAKENLLDNLFLLLAVNLAFFVIYSPYLVFWLIPRELYQELSAQIQSLDERLSPEKIASAISVEYQNMPTSGINPLMAYVKNNNSQPITCFAVMTDFYRGSERYDDRYFPSGVLRWRDQTDSNVKKTIHPGLPAAQLSLATANNNQELKLMLAQEPTRIFKGEHTYSMKFEIRGTMNTVEFAPVQCSLTFTIKPSPTVKRRMILVIQQPTAPVVLETQAQGNR